MKNSTLQQDVERAANRLQTRVYVVLRSIGATSCYTIVDEANLREKELVLYYCDPSSPIQRIQP